MDQQSGRVHDKWQMPWKQQGIKEYGRAWSPKLKSTAPD